VDLRQYINELMVSTGGCASSGYPITSCKIYPDKSYAFLELRSVEEASNCMAFDGVAFKDSYLRVRPECLIRQRSLICTAAENRAGVSLAHCITRTLSSSLRRQAAVFVRGRFHAP
jgi:hypothetical protein